MDNLYIVEILLILLTASDHVSGQLQSSEILKNLPKLALSFDTDAPDPLKDCMYLFVLCNEVKLTRAFNDEWKTITCGMNQFVRFKQFTNYCHMAYENCRLVITRAMEGNLTEYLVVGRMCEDMKEVYKVLMKQRSAVLTAERRSANISSVRRRQIFLEIVDDLRKMSKTVKESQPTLQFHVSKVGTDTLQFGDRQEQPQQNSNIRHRSQARHDSRGRSNPSEFFDTQLYSHNSRLRHRRDTSYVTNTSNTKNNNKDTQSLTLVDDTNLQFSKDNKELRTITKVKYVSDLEAFEDEITYFTRNPEEKVKYENQLKKLKAEIDDIHKKYYKKSDNKI